MLWIRSKRYRRISWGNASHLGCLAWSFLLNNSSTDWSFFLLSKIVFWAFTCFDELMFFLTVLFFLLIVSLQVSYLNLLFTEVRYSFLCSWSRCVELNFESLCPRVQRLLPAGLICSFYSLAILAFFGSTKLGSQSFGFRHWITCALICRFIWVGCTGINLSVRHLEKRAKW